MGLSILIVVHATSCRNQTMILKYRVLHNGLSCGSLEDVALESAFKMPMSKAFPPRLFLLTAQGLISALNQKSDLRQIWRDNVIKGWELGGQPQLPDAEDDLKV